METATRNIPHTLAYQTPSKDLKIHASIDAVKEFNTSSGILSPTHNIMTPRDERSNNPTTPLKPIIRNPTKKLTTATKEKTQKQPQNTSKIKDPPNLP